MDLRTLKHRQSARTLERARVWAPDRFDVTYDEYWDGDESPERDTTCKHCSGTGGDPWNDRITPCEHCDGEGYEWWN